MTRAEPTGPIHGRRGAGSATALDGTAERPAISDAPRVRVWLQPVVIGLLILSAFITCYVGVQRDPEPHRLPIAVVGAPLAAQVEQALGDSVHVQTVRSGAAARGVLRRGDVVATLNSGRTASALSLHLAGAKGLSTTTAVERLVVGYAGGAHRHVTISDDIPLARFDSRGVAGFYVAFGVSLAGFVLAQSMLGLTRLLRLRHRFTLMVSFSALSGIVAAALADLVLDAVPGPVVPLAVALALLSAATAFTTKLLGTYLGPIGVPASTLLLLTIGNSTSGATIGANLLPAPAHAVSAILPPGAAVRAISDLSYFSGAHAAVPLLTLALWAAGSALLVTFWSRRRAKKRKRALPASDRRPAASLAFIERLLATYARSTPFVLSPSAIDLPDAETRHRSEPPA